MARLPDNYTSPETVAAMQQAASEAGDDFRALVCVFMFGGSDTHQMYVPLDGNNRVQYEIGRPVPVVGIATDEEPVHDLGTDPGWRLHPMMSTFYKMWEEEQLAIIRDVGTLNFPITKEQYFENLPGTRPVALFAHNVQQDIWQAALKHRVLRNLGWFGRTANLTDPYYNADQLVTFSSYSVAGSRLQGFAYDDKLTNVVPPATIRAGDRGPVSVGTWNEAISKLFVEEGLNSTFEFTSPQSYFNLLYEGLRDNFNYSKGLQDNLDENYDALPPHLIQRFTELRTYNEGATKYIINNQTEADYVNTEYFDGTFDGGVGYEVGDTITLINGATITVDSSDDGAVTGFTVTSRGSPFFPGVVWNHNYSPPISQDTTSGSGEGFALYPNINNVSGSDISNNRFRIQFMNALRTIYNRGDGESGLNQKRQLIMISPGGWDHHSDLRANQDHRLAEIDACVKSFRDSIIELGLDNNVTMFLETEFSRTFRSNPTIGTDHGWSGHMFVWGGSVAGGIYGEEPDYTFDGPYDTGRGRFIPRISTEQYYSTLLQWYGVPEEQTKVLLPNAEAFSPLDLGFMKENTRVFVGTPYQEFVNASFVTTPDPVFVSNFGGQETIVAVSFEDVLIPTNSEDIVRAELVLPLQSTATRPCDIRIEKSNTPGEPSNSNLPSSWVVSTEFVDHPIGITEETVTLNITPILEEFVNDQNWLAGTRLNIIIRDTLPGNTTPISTGWSAEGFQLRVTLPTSYVDPDPGEPGDAVEIDSVVLVYEADSELVEDDAEVHLLARNDEMSSPIGSQTDAEYYEIRGSNFVSGCTVLVSGSGVTVTDTVFVDDETLRITLEVDDEAPVGLRDLTVVNPDTSSDTINDVFEIFRAGLVPVSNDVMNDLWDSNTLFYFAPEFNVWDWPTNDNPNGDLILGDIAVGDIDTFYMFSPSDNYRLIGAVSFPDSGISQGATISKAVLRQRTRLHMELDSPGWPLQVEYGFLNDANPGQPGPAPLPGDWDMLSETVIASVPAPETPQWQPDLLDISVPLQQLVNLGSFAGNRINLRLFPVSTYINKMWTTYGAGLDPTPVKQRFRTIRLFVNW